MTLVQKSAKAIHLSLCLCAFAFSCELSAQISFQKTFGNVNGGEANSVILTKEGGYALAGWYDVNGLFSAEFYLVITDAAGDTLWTKTYGSATESLTKNLNGSGNEGYQVIQTQDDGFLFVGERHIVAGGQSDVYAVKISGDGKFEWSKLYGGMENDYGYSAKQTADNGFIISGFTESFGSGIRDMYLIKTDSLGETQWTKTFGGSSIDAAFDMQQTSDGGFILAGYSFSFSGSSDIYVIRTDQQGNMLWQKTYGGELNEIGHAILQTDDEGFIICGETESYGAGNTDAFLIKTNSEGEVDWSKTYGGENFEAALSIVQSIDGGYALTGYTRSFGKGNEDIFVIKTDTFGDGLWTKTYGGEFDDSGRSIKNTSDDGYVIAGYTKSFGKGFSDIYMIKTDSLGDSGCQQEVFDLEISSASITENIIISDISEGTISSTPSTRVGSTRTEISNPCDIINNIDEVDYKTGVSIYPNPAKELLFLKPTSTETTNSGQINIYNTTGQKLQSLPYPRTEVDIAQLPAGIYILILQIDNQSFSYKFTKY